MEVFPIIYSRNYYMDYSQNFYVSPKISEDCMKLDNIRKYILEAIRYPNMISRVRRIIVSENGYTMLGVVCDLRTYVKNVFGESSGFEKYVCDNKKRSVAAFIGIIFESKNLPQNHVVQNFDKIVVDLFTKYIADEGKWFGYTNHYDGELFNVLTEEYIMTGGLGEKAECYDKRIYQCALDNDEKLFNRIMSRCGGKRTKQCFCSDYYGIESVKTSQFCILSSRYVSKIRKCYGEDEEIQLVNKKKKFVTQKKTKIIITSGILFMALIILIIIMIEKN